MIGEKEDTEKVKNELENTCQKLGLKIFDKKQFFDYINKLNTEANEVFDYEKYTSGYFKNRFKL